VGVFVASKILEGARGVMRRRHLKTYRSERACIGRIKRYLKPHGMNLREDLAGGERSCIWSAVAKVW